MPLCHLKDDSLTNQIFSKFRGKKGKFVEYNSYNYDNQSDLYHKLTKQRETQDFGHLFWVVSVSRDESFRVCAHPVNCCTELCMRFAMYSIFFATNNCALSQK